MYIVYCVWCRWLCFGWQKPDDDMLVYVRADREGAWWNDQRYRIHNQPPYLMKLSWISVVTWVSAVNVAHPLWGVWLRWKAWIYIYFFLHCRGFYNDLVGKLLKWYHTSVPIMNVVFGRSCTNIFNIMKYENVNTPFHVIISQPSHHRSITKTIGFSIATSHHHRHHHHNLINLIFFLRTSLHFFIAAVFFGFSSAEIFHSSFAGKLEVFLIFFPL